MLTNACQLQPFSAGDLRRANGLLSRYGFFLREGGSLSVTAYNMLMKVLNYLLFLEMFTNYSIWILHKWLPSLDTDNFLYLWELKFPF